MDISDFLEGKVAYAFDSEEDCSDFLDKWYMYLKKDVNQKEKHTMQSTIIDGVLKVRSIMYSHGSLCWNFGVISKIVVYKRNCYLVELL